MVIPSPGWLSSFSSPIDPLQSIPQPKDVREVEITLTQQEKEERQEEFSREVEEAKREIEEADLRAPEKSKTLKEQLASFKQDLEKLLRSQESDEDGDQDDSIDNVARDEEEDPEETKLHKDKDIMHTKVASKVEIADFACHTQKYVSLHKTDEYRDPFLQRIDLFKNRFVGLLGSQLHQRMTVGTVFSSGCLFSLFSSNCRGK